MLDEIAGLSCSRIEAAGRPATEAQTLHKAFCSRWRHAMSAALMLPYVWAESSPEDGQPVAASAPEGGIAFYRKRTELLLRRYMLVSLQAGRVPSVIGNDVFRGKATSYRMHYFEDMVIFLFDIEKCLKRLDPSGRELIARIALQEYTQEEAAQLMGLSFATVKRKYTDALDELSRIFLDLGLLEID